MANPIPIRNRDDKGCEIEKQSKSNSCSGRGLQIVLTNWLLGKRTLGAEAYLSPGLR
jgi:hypothetical protein